MFKLKIDYLARWETTSTLWDRLTNAAKTSTSRTGGNTFQVESRAELLRILNSYSVSFMKDYNTRNPRCTPRISFYIEIHGQVDGQFISACRDIHTPEEYKKFIAQELNPAPVVALSSYSKPKTK